MLTSRGLGRVLGDLAEMGFNARWGVLGAADVGAPHQRDRIWIAGWRDVLPHPKHNGFRRREQQSESIKQTDVADPNGVNDAVRGDGENDAKTMVGRGVHTRGSISNSWSGHQEVARKSDGMANPGQIGCGSKETEQGLEGRLGPTFSSMDRKWWEREPGETSRTIEPGMGGMVNGMAARVDRIAALGNGQVSEVARRAWEILSDQR
jgi:DNA (cytosine-5)-methyltransferase 1